MWFNYGAAYDLQNRIESGELSLWTEDGSKPIVYYLGEVLYIEQYETKRAIVKVLNHPAYGADTITTSAVIKELPDGTIETMNTLYKPYSFVKDC